MMQLNTEVELIQTDLAFVDGINGTVSFQEGSNVTIAGFGMTDIRVQQRSNILMRAELPIATRRFCQQQNPLAYLRHEIDFSNVICTGGPAGKDSCNGDSGGPVIYRNASGAWWLIGVLSKGSELPSESARNGRKGGWEAGWVRGGQG